MNEDLINQIKRNIKKTGYPLEFETSKIVKENGWRVTVHPLHYIEETEKLFKETGNLSEMDIVAVKTLPKSQILIYLIIECKKSAKPWVFFRGDAVANVYSLNIASVDDEARYRMISKSEYCKKHHYFKDSNFCVWYMPPKLAEASETEKRPEEKPNEIFKAIAQLITGLNFYVERSEEKFYKYKLTAIDTEIFHPVIVLDGNLFEANLSGEDLEVTPVEHVKLITSLELKEPRPMKETDQTSLISQKQIIIDVLKKEFLKKFLGFFE
jgi:hypothetical protein